LSYDPPYWKFIGKFHFFIVLIGDKRNSKVLAPQSILDSKPTKNTAMRLATAELSRACLRDTYGGASTCKKIRIFLKKALDKFALMC